jgi:hypothetical protein
VQAHVSIIPSPQKSPRDKCVVFNDIVASENRLLFSITSWLLCANDCFAMASVNGSNQAASFCSPTWRQAVALFLKPNPECHLLSINP